MPEPRVIRLLVVDDEELARELLCGHAARRDDVEVVGQAGTGAEALELIPVLRPDVILLDVEMPGLDGFEVLARLDSASGTLPLVVFVTSFNRYAVRAFEVNAVDYLLKPVTEERFDAAMTRCRERPPPQPASVQNLLEDVLHVPPRRLLVRERKRIVPLALEEIDWIEADGDYVTVHAGGKSHHLDRTLTAMEKLLAKKGFARVHRRAVVNLDRISELRPLGSARYELLLQQGTRIIVSRSYSEIFRRKVL